MAAVHSGSFQQWDTSEDPLAKLVVADYGVGKHVNLTTISILRGSARRHVPVLVLVSTVVMLAFLILRCFTRLYRKKGSERSRHLSGGSEGCAGGDDKDKEEEAGNSERAPLLGSGRGSSQSGRSADIAILMPDDAALRRAFRGPFVEGVVGVVVAIIIIIIIGAFKEALNKQKFDL